MQILWPENFHFVGRARPDGLRVSSAQIAACAVQIGDELRARGVGAGDRVALWLTDGVDQVSAMLGCWMAGATFCVLPSYAGRTNTDRSQDRIRGVLSVLAPKLLIDARSHSLPDVVSGTYQTLTLPDFDPVAVDAKAPGPLSIQKAADDMAFVQFTSGSTGGDARGAVVRFGQLKANLDALAHRTAMTDGDCMVSWAPLYHDMGLMAVLLSLNCGADLVLMETDHFVRRPSAWLDAISKYKGTHSTAPPTALKLLSRRKAMDVDLSSWRYAWIGGEAVFPKVLEAFEQAYAPAGLSKGVMQPTYGMAETVVGISCGEPGSRWQVQKGAVSCGPPLEDMQVRIVGDDSAPVDKGREGRIMVRGPSVMAGYLGQPRFAENAWFETGDLGFLRDGLVYVTGRIKDVLKRGGESFPAALVEEVAEQALALRTGRAAVFSIPRVEMGKEEIVLLVESRNWQDDHARTVAAAVVRDLGLQIDVIRATNGTRLPRTSSGKLMRQQAAALYRKGLI